MTPPSKPLFLAACFSTAYAIASAVTGFAADTMLGGVATALLLGLIVWLEHAEHERQRKATERLWMASYRHDVWARRGEQHR